MPAAADQLTSPYDTDARYSTKRHIEWIGYKVHFTETCDANTPHLMVNVETTPATTPDDHMAAVVHASLKPRNLLPSEHLVDKGYTDSHILVESQRHYGVTIVGPVADDPGWQAREGTGFDKSQFVVDWERQVVTCPAGKQSISWLPHTYPASGMAIEAVLHARTAGRVPFGRAARGRRSSHGLWGCRSASRMRRCRRPASDRQPRHSSTSMRSDQASKAHTNKPSDGVAYGKVAILDWRKPICSMSSPPPRSISCGWRHGWREHLWPIRAAHHLRPSRRRRSRGALNANSPHPPRSPASLLVRLNQRVQPCTACATLCRSQGSRPIAAAELPPAVYSCTAA